MPKFKVTWYRHDAYSVTFEAPSREKALQIAEDHMDDGIEDILGNYRHEDGGLDGIDCEVVEPAN